MAVTVHLYLLHHHPPPFLTLGARGTLPAFLADAGERIPRHHAGTSILTRVWKAARVFGWEQREKGQVCFCQWAFPNNQEDHQHNHEPQPNSDCLWLGFFSLLLPDSLNFPFSYALYSLTLKCTVSAIRHFKHTSVGTQRRERNGRDESGRESWQHEGIKTVCGPRRSDRSD